MPDKASIYRDPTPDWKILQQLMRRLLTLMLRSEGSDEKDYDGYGLDVG